MREVERVLWWTRNCARRYNLLAWLAFPNFITYCSRTCLKASSVR